MENKLNQLVETCTDIVLDKEITAEDLNNMSCDEFKQLFGKYSMRSIRTLVNKLKDVN